MPQLTEIQSQIARTNWACLVGAIYENIALETQTTVNYYLQLHQTQPALPLVVPNTATVSASQQPSASAPVPAG